LADIAVSILSGGLVLATPLLMVALGEMFVERSGILNLGTEGMMLMGAFTSLWAAEALGSLWLGLLVGMIAGATFGLLMGFFSITLRADQIVTGIALTLFGIGLTTYLNHAIFGLRPPSIPLFSPINIPGLSGIQYLGPILFSQNILVYLTLLLVPAAGIVLYRTPFGLQVRAVGENPEAADSLGISVSRVRYSCLIIGGLLAGLGGAYLTLAYLGRFTDDMTAGSGWIAIVIVILGGWSPYGAFGGSLLFGTVEVLQYRLQTGGSVIPYEFLLMLPYIIATIVLVVAFKWSRGRKPPAALAIPYERK
jgi:ABC-type uncharacterized transport system permease subunit